MRTHQPHVRLLALQRFPPHALLVTTRGDVVRAVGGKEAKQQLVQGQHSVDRHLAAGRSLISNRINLLPFADAQLAAEELAREHVC